MASLFTHALVGSALGQAADHEWRKDWRFWSLVVTCSVLPDADSIGFHAGVPYGALWGHRGMTHSLCSQQSWLLLWRWLSAEDFRRRGSWECSCS